MKKTISSRPSSAEKHLRYARIVAKLLDGQWSFFGFQVGLDPILGLVPGFGDALTVFFSFYLVWIAVQLEMPIHRVLQMIANIAFDFLIGFLPVIGDIADFFFHSNIKNLEILEQHVKDMKREVNDDYVIVQENR